VRLSCSPRDTSTCSTPPISASDPHSPPRTSSASPARYPCITAIPTTSNSRPTSHPSNATCTLGRSQAASGRVTTGSPVGSVPKCCDKRRRSADSGCGECCSAHCARRFSAPASSSGSIRQSSHSRHGRSIDRRACRPASREQDWHEAVIGRQVRASKCRRCNPLLLFARCDMRGAGSATFRETARSVEDQRPASARAADHARCRDSRIAMAEWEARVLSKPSPRDQR
jgi:hypothetical protein